MTRLIEDDRCWLARWQLVIVRQGVRAALAPSSYPTVPLSWRLGASCPGSSCPALPSRHMQCTLGDALAHVRLQVSAVQQELAAAKSEELAAAKSNVEKLTAAKETLRLQQEKVGIDGEAAEVAWLVSAAVTVESPPADRVGLRGAVE